MFEIEDYIKKFRVYPAPEAKKLWEQEYNGISVHTRAVKPAALIEKRRPFEDEEIKKYRIDNYEPITATIFSRAIDNLQRIMSGAQASVNVDDKLREYLGQPQFKGYDFKTFINKKVIRRMIEDPNGVLLWWPTGEGLKAANMQVDVEPRLILNTQIHHFNDEVFTYLSRDKSMITVETNDGVEKRKEGEVYYIATKQGYYRYFQVGKKSDNKFKMEPVYEHNMDKLPVIQLGGEEADEIKKNGSSIQYLKTYFYSAVPYANEAIRQFSDHQGVMVTAAFPIREIEQQPCHNKSCQDGSITIIEGEGPDAKRKTTDCPTCSGRGYIVPLSPYGVMYRKKSGKLMNDDKGGLDRPMMRYISPDTGIVELSGKHWRDLLKDAEKALNLLFIDEAQSGVAKEIDREDKHSTLDKIGANVYSVIVLKSLRIIERLRNINSDAASISVTLPATFQSKNEQQLINEVVTLREKQAPGFLVAQATVDYVKKRYSGDRSMQRAVEFLAIYDPIFHLTQTEKDNLLSNAAITEERHARSLYAFAMIRQLATDKGDEFLTMKHEQIAKEIDKMIAPLVNRAAAPTTLPNG